MLSCDRWRSTSTADYPAVVGGGFRFTFSLQTVDNSSCVHPTAVANSGQSQPTSEPWHRIVTLRNIDVAVGDIDRMAAPVNTRGGAELRWIDWLVRRDDIEVCDHRTAVRRRPERPRGEVAYTAYLELDRSRAAPTPNRCRAIN